MQGLILAEHEHQRSLHLLHRYGDRAIAESLTELSHPGLYRFRGVLQLSAFALRGAGCLQAPHMLLIRPIDTHERRELGLLLQHLDLCHSSLLTLLDYQHRAGRLCSRETLIGESYLACSKRRPSIRLGSKARPLCSRLQEKPSCV